MKQYLDTAVELAKKAGALQLEKLHLDKKIEYKGSKFNPVTEVDKACEKLICDEIKKKFPDHDIMAEEGSGMDRKKDWLWIIDPIDGTVNYSHAYPLFSVSIGLMHKGEMVAGVVFEPNRNELFVAEKGVGAFCNGKPLKVSKTPSLDEAMLSTGFAYNMNETVDNNLNHFNQLIRHCHAIRRDGVASVDLCYVALGRFDGFWELFLKPWDIAAGGLILQEAGGRVSMFDGSPLDWFGDEILATNGVIHDRMVELLNP